LKMSFASILVAALIIPMKILTLIGASGMAVLMSVAVISHAKVKDELTKYGAALVMLILSIYLLVSVRMGCVPDSFELDLANPQLYMGIVVAVTCFLMWTRSFLRGDYNLDNYETLPEA